MTEKIKDRLLLDAIKDSIKYTYPKFKDIVLDNLKYKVYYITQNSEHFYIELLKNDDTENDYALSEPERFKVGKVDTNNLLTKCGYVLDKMYDKEKDEEELNLLASFFNPEPVFQKGETIDDNKLIFKLRDPANYDVLYYNGIIITEDMVYDSDLSIIKDVLPIICKGDLVLTLKDDETVPEPEESIDLQVVMDDTTVTADTPLVVTRNMLFHVDNMQQDNYFYPTVLEFNSIKKAFSILLETVPVKDELSKVDFSDFNIKITNEDDVNGYITLSLLPDVHEKKYSNVDTFKLYFKVSPLNDVFKELGYKLYCPLERKDDLLMTLPTGVEYTLVDNVLTLTNEYNIKSFDTDATDSSLANILLLNGVDFLTIKFKNDSDEIAKDKIESGEYDNEDGSAIAQLAPVQIINYDIKDVLVPKDGSNEPKPIV